MLTVWIIVAYVFYVFLNIGIAIWQKSIRDHRLRLGDPAQINRPLWAFLYVVSVVPFWFILHSWWFIGALILLYVSILPVANNLVNGNPPFHLSKTTDKIMVSMGFTSTEKVNLLALCVSIGLLIKTIFNG